MSGVSRIPIDHLLRRRVFLARSGLSLGGVALASLLQRDAVAQVEGPHHGRPDLPHHTPRAKRVIFLYMSGGPSQLELFDYKPRLIELDGQPMPASVTQGQPVAQLQGQQLNIMRPIAAFRRHGQSGQRISDYLPWQARIADDLCIVRSMVTDQINHDPAHTFMNTGTAISGRPSIGAWVNYGLGSEADDLPGFVVLTSSGGRSPQPISARMWGAGFLPSHVQGVEFNSFGAPVHYLQSPPGVNSQQQQRVVDTINSLNAHRQQRQYDPETDARIAAYEMAFRMQTSIPELMDLSDESPETLAMYGAVPGDGSFASNCLLARRLAERGVRFIQLYHRGWDHHDYLARYMDISCRLTDKPTWALITDLKQRGLLDDTLVIWGGEFGRTPMSQTKSGGMGRDHHIKGYSLWLAGAGVRGGTTYGATDELGYHAVENVVHVRDLHSTMLHLLGIDSQRFQVKFQGLDMRLTGVEPAHVVHGILS